MFFTVTSTLKEAITLRLNDGLTIHRRQCQSGATFSDWIG